MRQVKRLLPYVRRYVQMAVYDVVADKVAQYLENELMINRRCFVPDRHYAV